MARTTVRKDAGRFKRGKAPDPKPDSAAESVRRTLVGQGNPAQWPDRNRYLEGIFKRLCEIHRGPKRIEGRTITRWNLIISNHTSIHNCVLSNFRVITDTKLQLHQVNTTTLTQWFHFLEKAQETLVLQQTDRPESSLTADDKLPEANPTVSKQTAPAAKPLTFDLPPTQSEPLVEINRQQSKNHYRDS